MKHVLVELVFKVHRGLVIERAVEPHPVVKDFDPFKDRRARGGARGKNLMMNQPSFQGAPKTFHQRVVVAVAFAGHAGNNSGLGQSLPVGGTGVLDAAVRVMPAKNQIYSPTA